MREAICEKRGERSSAVSGTPAFPSCFHLASGPGARLFFCFTQRNRSREWTLNLDFGERITKDIEHLLRYFLVIFISPFEISLFRSVRLFFLIGLLVFLTLFLSSLCILDINLQPQGELEKATLWTSSSLKWLFPGYTELLSFMSAHLSILDLNSWANRFLFSKYSPAYFLNRGDSERRFRSGAWTRSDTLFKNSLRINKKCWWKMKI